MPRHSSRTTQSQTSLSQSSRSKKSGPRANGTLTQTRIEDHCALSQLNTDDLVKNCVRYFVNNAGPNMYFRRAEIQKQVAPKSGQQFQQIIEKTAEILKSVYGYNLLVCDQATNTAKGYVISNSMPYINYNLSKEEPQPNDVRRILLLLILSHIYMSNFPVIEASLYSFLKYLKIEPGKRHPLFGNVKDYIMNTLVKQKYLLMETDPVSKKVSFSWGLRAEKEISKHEVLKFVCKMFRDRQPKSWANQFQAANEQGFENDQEAEADAMDVDD